MIELIAVLRIVANISLEMASSELWMISMVTGSKLAFRFIVQPRPARSTVSVGSRYGDCRIRPRAVRGPGAAP